MGVKLTLYNDIKARLEAKVPELLTIRKWNNQFNNEEKEHAFKYPACFIGFSSMDWDSPNTKTPQSLQLQQQQNGLITITLYLGFHDLQDESPAFEDYEPIIQKVWYWIQGWTATGATEYTALLRSSEREDNNHNNVIVWELDFTTRVTDCAGLDDTLVDATPVTLVINADLIIDADTVENMRTDAELP